MKLLGIAGSLREGSYNRSLLRAARELLPEGVELVECEIGGLPFYDGDVEAAGDPEPVVALKNAIRDADALLIATPEYNRGVPGVLKNAVDWASRPPLGSPLTGKHVALMGASTGRAGTALDNALAVWVRDVEGKPVQDATVTFRIVAGAGSFTRQFDRMAEVTGRDADKIIAAHRDAA